MANMYEADLFSFTLTGNVRKNLKFNVVIYLKTKSTKWKHI